MKRKIALLTVLCLSIPAFGTGWVYMGFYPFLYDADTNGWSYALEPVIWHQDILTGDWQTIGSQPENFIPEDLTGQVLTICESQSCWEAVYHGYTFLTDNEATAWSFAAMADGYLDDAAYPALYSLRVVGQNKALLVTAPADDKGLTECLVLEFTSPQGGTFTGLLSALNTSGNRILDDQNHGTFEMGPEGPQVSSRQ